MAGGHTPAPPSLGRHCVSRETCRSNYNVPSGAVGSHQRKRRPSSSAAATIMASLSGRSIVSP